VVGGRAGRQWDVGCLEEEKAPTEAFPFAELSAAGYHAYVHGQPRYNGVAVLSRLPGKAQVVGLPGTEAAGARLLSDELGDLVVTSVYVPNGKSVEHADYQGKLAWLAALREHMAQVLATSSRVLLAGDFNVAPTDLDTYDPQGCAGQIHHSEPERSAIAALLDLGLVDLMRAKHPELPAYSWWDYRAGAFHRNQGLRIDCLLGSAALVGGLADAWVDREWRKKRDDLTPSDHAPVVAELG